MGNAEVARRYPGHETMEYEFNTINQRLHFSTKRSSRVTPYG